MNLLAMRALWNTYKGDNGISSDSNIYKEVGSYSEPLDSKFNSLTTRHIYCQHLLKKWIILVSHHNLDYNYS